MSDRLTGREVARLCKEVTARMLAEMNPEIPKLVDDGLRSIQSYEIKVRPLRHIDFDPFFCDLAPDTSSKDLQNYDQWGGKVKESVL